MSPHIGVLHCLCERDRYSRTRDPSSRQAVAHHTSSLWGLQTGIHPLTLKASPVGLGMAGDNEHQFVTILSWLCFGIKLIKRLPFVRVFTENLQAAVQLVLNRFAAAQAPSCRKQSAHSDRGGRSGFVFDPISVPASSAWVDNAAFEVGKRT